MIGEEIAALKRIASRHPPGPNTRSVQIAQIRVRIKRRLRRLGVPVQSEISNHELIALARAIFKLEAAAGDLRDREQH